jgi:hypothetical protein
MNRNDLLYSTFIFISQVIEGLHSPQISFEMGQNVQNYKWASEFKNNMKK